VVKSQQGRAEDAYKKKHSFNRRKFFFVQNLHDFDEGPSAKWGWHRRCLIAAERGKYDFLSPNPSNHMKKIEAIIKPFKLEEV